MPYKINLSFCGKGKLLASQWLPFILRAACPGKCEIRGQVKQTNWSWSLPERILLTPFFNSSLKPMTSLSTVKRASVYWQTNSFWQLDLGCWERFYPAWNSAVTPCANWWVQTHFSPSLKSARAVKYFSIGSNFLGISDF